MKCFLILSSTNLRRSSVVVALASAATLAPLSSVVATPAQVIIIRHGEKPLQGNELIPQGCARAYSLPNFFATNSEATQFGAPVAFYAGRPDLTSSDPDASIRPPETIAPTAQAFGKPILAEFTPTQYSGVVSEIMNRPEYNGKTVVMSWEHKAIPGLAKAFGAALQKGENDWPGDVFDEAWVIRFDANTKAATLDIIAESVLQGDNPEGGHKHWDHSPGPFNMNSVSQAIQQTCTNDDVIRALTYSLATPTLPPFIPKQ